MTQNIAIVGSGFLGMTLALRLAERGDNVTLFESATRSADWLRHGRSAM